MGTEIEHPNVNDLRAFVSGRTSDAQETEIGAHIETCEVCRKLLEQSPTDGFEHRIRAAAKPAAHSSFVVGTRIAEFKTGNLPTRSKSPMPIRIGEFQILREIGRGGMGVVYEAEQPSLERRVALKVLPPHLLDQGSMRQRFEREAKAAGKLHHTNIVPVFGVGEVDDQPYYVMQYIHGKSLNGFVGDARTVAGFGHQAALALDYAHRQGVLHRDIKPSNLLLDERGTVWITDFGLAKMDDQQNLTVTGDLLGTIRYMPPEAFDGRVEPSGDIYSLGITLYELIAGVPAFDQKERSSLIKQVTSETPRSLAERKPAVPHDIVTIIHKAIDREPAGRYATAGEMAADLQRFLADEPIRARRLSTAERLMRWARRNQGVATLLAVSALLLIAGTLASTWAALNFRELASERELARKGAVEANNAANRLADERETNRKAAVEANLEAQRREKFERWERYRSNIRDALSARQADNLSGLKLALESAPEEHRNWEWKHLYVGLNNTTAIIPGCLAFSPKTNQFVTGSGNVANLHQLGKDEPVARFEIPLPLEVVWFSPSGQLLALRFGKNLQIRDTQSHRIVCEHVLPGSAQALFFTLDETECFPIVEDNDQALRGMRWSLKDASVSVEMGAFADSSEPVIFERLCLGEKIYSPLVSAVQIIDYRNSKIEAEFEGRLLGFSPDKARFAIYSKNKLCFRDSRTGELHASVDITEVSRKSAWSPKGDYFATAEAYPGTNATLWDTVTYKPLVNLAGHGNAIEVVQFSPDGKRLLTASHDQTIRLWAIPTGRLISTLRGHRSPLRYAKFSPDGSRIVSSATNEPMLRVWDGRTGEPIALLSGDCWDQLGFTGDGSVIYAHKFNTASPLNIWEMAQVERNGILRGHTQSVTDVAWSPDGRRLASCAWDNTVRIWDAFTGSPIQTLVQKSSDGDRNWSGMSVSFHSDGNRLSSVARSNGGQCRVAVWDTAKGRMLAHWDQKGDTEHIHACWDPKGEYLLSGSTEGAVLWYRPDLPELAHRLPGHESHPDGRSTRYTETCVDVSCSPDGKRFVSSGYDGTVRVGDLVERKWLSAMKGHTQQVLRARFSPDGKLLASCGTDGTVRLWDAGTFEPIATLEHGSAVYGIAFTPDSSRLASGCEDGSIRLWDMATRTQVAELRGHTNYVHSVAFSPDGTRLASASGDTTIRIWETRSARERTSDGKAGDR